MYDSSRLFQRCGKDNSTLIRNKAHERIFLRKMSTTDLGRPCRHRGNKTHYVMLQPELSKQRYAYGNIATSLW
jgi:hypothetical protein